MKLLRIVCRIFPNDEQWISQMMNILLAIYEENTPIQKLTFEIVALIHFLNNQHIDDLIIIRTIRVCTGGGR